MAGLLDSISGFFSGPADPEAIDPRYGITQQQLYDTKMQSLGSAGLTLLAAGQRMQPEQRAQILAGLGNIPGQYQQGISQAMQQRLLASQLRSGEQDLAAREAFAKRLSGVLPGAAPTAGAPVAGAMPGAAMPGAAMPGAAMPGAAMPGAAARLTQPMPPSATNAAASAIAPTAAAAPSADLASLNLTAQEAAYIAQLPPSEQMSAYNQLQVKKLTEKPEFAERPMTPAEIAAGGLDASLPWYLGKDGPFIPGGRPPAGSTTNINMAAPKVYDAEMAKTFNADVSAAITQGRTAVSGLNTVKNIRSMLDAGAFTGPLAEKKTELTLLANELGLADNDTLRKAENSQQLMTLYANRNLEAAKQMEGQGAIAEKERELIAQAAGGGIAITADVQRRILEILEKGYKKQAELGKKAIDFKRPNAYERMPEFYELMAPKIEEPPPAPVAQPAPAAVGGKVFRYNPTTKQMEAQ